MNGSINSDGRLVIDRDGISINQACPYGGNSNVFCGHWCPFFGEPEPDTASLLQYNLTKEQVKEIAKAAVRGPDSILVLVDSMMMGSRSENSTLKKPIVKLQLCRRTLTFDSLIDERGK